MSRDLDLDAVVLATAVLLLLVTLAIATVPGLGVLVPSTLQGAGEFFGASIASWIVAIALALAALVGLGFLKGRHRSVAETDDAESDAETGGGEDGSERAEGAPGSAGAVEIVGEALTEEYLQRREALRSRSGPPEIGPTDGLENAAIAMELARGHDAETAHERLRSGAWTDDPVAAAFLGDETAGSLGLRRRLYGVLSPHRAFERRFERTLAELEAVAERTSGIGGSPGEYGSVAERDGEQGGEQDAADAASQDDRSAVEHDRTADDGRGGAEGRVAGGS